MALFDGTEGSAIELSLASAWTENYRISIKNETTEPVVKAHFYGREILQKILEQEGCVGIRIYYALDENKQKQLILVGADESGNDMEGLVVDNSKICPPDCSQEGELNG